MTSGAKISSSDGAITYHLLGRPNSSWKRTQVLLVVLFWLWRIFAGEAKGPRLLWLRALNRRLRVFTPWQIIASTLTAIYAIRNLDSLIGLGAPEPLARLYSRAYYRATWINTGLDAGFATAMTIRTKWLRDIASVIFSAYYIIYANAGEEKLRKFRAVCTVEMLRVTWEKTLNPYLRFFTSFDRERVAIVKQLLLPRPSSSPHKRPIAAWLFYSGSEQDLALATDLIIDFPGGGFISMTPAHHEERLRRWALRTGMPVLSIDYGKAPEYPFPFAIEECFDAYRQICSSQGRIIGMSGQCLDITMTGDSAGANLVATVMFKILESSTPLQHPIALALSYACLDFNFTSWMSPAGLRALRSESSSQIPGFADRIDHLAHHSPLSMVKDVDTRRVQRKKSWAQSLPGLPSPFSKSKSAQPTTAGEHRAQLFRSKTNATFGNRASAIETDEDGHLADQEGEDDVFPPEERKPISAYVIYSDPAQHIEQQAELAQQRNLTAGAKNAPIDTRLTMTSRTGYFQDRVIAPTMMRTMAILYIGPKRNPDFQTDYYLSPTLAPDSLLSQFPPLLLTCGEKDPFVDDTLIFAERVRGAKRARKHDLVCAAAGKGGESLRMSTARGATADRLLKESEDDWVQMEIIDGWSHGFLQMPFLLPEAWAFIDHIADWLKFGFEKWSLHPQHSGPKERVQYQPDLGELHVMPEADTDRDEVLRFTTKKRRGSPPSRRRAGSSDETLHGSPPPEMTASCWGAAASSTPLTAGQTPTPIVDLIATALIGKSGGVVPPRALTPLKVAQTELLRRRMQDVVSGLGERAVDLDENSATG